MSAPGQPGAPGAGPGSGPRIIAIAVLAANGVIGDGASQPFSFREDWARFKRTTLGHPLVVGHRTHRAMGLLPGRTSIVMSHDPASVVFPESPPAGSRGIAVHDLDEALALAAGLDEDRVFICGGGQVYRAAMDRVDELDLTLVHAEATGQVTFPAVDPARWREIERVPGKQFDFVRYVRADAPAPGTGPARAGAEG